MYLERLRLDNYAAIMNGLKTDSVEINFTKFKDKIILIKGPNGIGKTTIQQANKPIPDSNDSFIKGKVAKKELDYYDEVNMIRYKIVFVHECTKDGERATAKGYFTKIYSNGYVEDLNPSGNISPCKDIIFEEFKLDPCFMTLIQLSNTKRGLADLRPSERKRYIGSIAETQFYNDINKNLCEKDRRCKKMLDTISMKLNSIKDESILKNDLNMIDTKIRDMEISNDAYISKRADLLAKISIMDPTGSVATEIHDNASKLKELLSIRNSLSKDINNKIMSLSGYSDSMSLSEYKENIIKDMNLLKINISSNDNTYNFLSDRILSLLSTSSSKRDTMMKLSEGIAYSELNNLKIGYEQTINSTIDIFDKLNIEMDIKDISKSEFELCLNVLKDIFELTDFIKSEYDTDVITYSINNASSRSIGDNKTVADLDLILSEKNTKLNQLVKDIELGSSIKRPKECTIDTCPYVNEHIGFYKALDNNRSQFDILTKEINSIIEKRKVLVEQEEFISMSNILKKDITILNKYINTIKPILQRISPKYNSNKYNILDAFDTNILLVSDIDYQSIKSGLDNVLQIKGLFDEYVFLKDKIQSINIDLDKISKSVKSIKAIEAEISLIDTEINSLESEKNKISEDTTRLDSELFDLSIILGICEECIIIKSNLNKTNKSIEDIEKLIQDKNDIIQAITLNNREIRDIDNNIYNIKNSLNSYRNEKENINYNLNMIFQYNTEYNEYKSKFEKIKVLKYHSTPTTGIQLMFIDMYISKILGAANELICRLFNNQFTLLPFIITENEFAIPVAVNGGINHDDISSMSGAQIAIISMVISVAILSQTSTKLNILIPDEVDATFDEVNRREYLNMINTLIAMIGSNQCILVSHNSEYNITDESTIYLQEYCSNY